MDSIPTNQNAPLSKVPANFPALRSSFLHGVRSDERYAASLPTRRMLDGRILFLQITEILYVCNCARAAVIDTVVDMMHTSLSFPTGDCIPDFQ